MHRHTAGSRASTNFLHHPARSLRRLISLLSTFGAVAGVQLQTSRSIKPRERDLGDLRLFVLVRFFTRPTNRPRHAACASNYESKPVRPLSTQSNPVLDLCNTSRGRFRRSSREGGNCRASAAADANPLNRRFTETPYNARDREE